MNPPDDVTAAIPWRMRNIEQRVDHIDSDLDTKADKTTVDKLDRKMDWVIGSLFLLTLTIASSVITLLVALGGGH